MPKKYESFDHDHELHPFSDIKKISDKDQVAREVVENSIKDATGNYSSLIAMSADEAIEIDFSNATDDLCYVDKIPDNILPPELVPGNNSPIEEIIVPEVQKVKLSQEKDHKREDSRKRNGHHSSKSHEKNSDGGKSKKVSFWPHAEVVSESLDLSLPVICPKKRDQPGSEETPEKLDISLSLASLQKVLISRFRDAREARYISFSHVSSESLDLSLPVICPKKRDQPGSEETPEKLDISLSLASLQKVLISRFCELLVKGISFQNNSSMSKKDDKNQCKCEEIRSDSKLKTKVCVIM
ncbi:unnamed protein product [Caenorhabditis auriculariae]|uniref:Uncharacterized protein n=1 Tax=Caenorhabditis auriculariae TaxID=2777116 RepID=A0A8S1H507_9PELO|nr:unnamed protein product [Caenorhabditis auriculariae]